MAAMPARNDPARSNRSLLTVCYLLLPLPLGGSSERRRELMLAPARPAAYAMADPYTIQMLLLSVGAFKVT